MSSNVVAQHINKKRKQVHNVKKEVAKLTSLLHQIERNISQLTQRFQTRERKLLERRKLKTRNQIQKFKSGMTIQEYDERIRPYMEVASTLHTNTEAQQLLVEFLADMEEGVEKLETFELDACPTCDGRMKLDAPQSLLVCQKCCQTVPYIDSVQQCIGYDEDTQISSGYNYERLGYFNSWLQKFQAKETMVIPNTILEQVMEDLWSMGVSDSEKINRNSVRDSLRRLDMSNLYDHATQIVCRITGKRPPRMTRKQEENMRIMFSKMQEHWDEIKDRVSGGKRRNFLSYGYCLYKFCELLGYTQFMGCFSLLKGQEKLKGQDLYWTEFCKVLGWKYISST